ncbi:hypothetical protein CFE53_01255 [Methanofervidicoccus sp. A16]|uniref:P-loop domain-containing protein n=1 Tax=Methanofervidicoccus sp. A16 TaxID=2607662 RepID=UPI001187F10F|nr:P-loop domain-containing protein [Methanofervidicoccus sp. A16]AXI24861.1 hypothetical protein CFE53_01255 [Methanofervidicoccus sp. A16]
MKTWEFIREVIKNIKTPNLNRTVLTSSNKNKLFYTSAQGDGKVKVVLPFVFRREDLINLNPKGLEGSTARIIECIKEEMRRGKFPPLSGNLGRRYRELYEPLTVVNCDMNIGSNLWRADRYNYIEGDRIHLLLRMVFSERDPRSIGRKIDELSQELEEYIDKIPYSLLERENINIVNQKDLRDRLDDLGLVVFIGDYSKPARSYTPVRRHFRIAGPKEGVNVPFITPKELNPVEVELYDGRVITGLGIKKREVFVITGRNAQGKTTLLEGIESGQDDHLLGDGREYIITTKNLTKVTGGSMDMQGCDISLFFEKLPKGLKGTPERVVGRASTSMTMAYRIQRAMTNGVDLILIDEDNSAVNLLVSGLLSKWFEGVKSLSEIMMREREKLTSAFIITTSSLDLLTALADRAIYLEDHEAKYLDLDYFREELSKYYLELSRELRRIGGDRDGGITCSCKGSNMS